MIEEQRSVLPSGRRGLAFDIALQSYLLPLIVSGPTGQHLA